MVILLGREGVSCGNCGGGLRLCFVKGKRAVRCKGCAAYVLFPEGFKRLPLVALGAEKERGGGNGET